MNIDPLALAEPLGRGHLGTHYLELCRGAVLLVCEQLESIELQHVLEIAFLVSRLDNGNYRHSNFRAFRNLPPKRLRNYDCVRPGCQWMRVAVL